MSATEEVTDALEVVRIGYAKQVHTYAIAHRGHRTRSLKRG